MILCFFLQALNKTYDSVKLFDMTTDFNEVCKTRQTIAKTILNETMFKKFNCSNSTVEQIYKKIICIQHHTYYIKKQEIKNKDKKEEAR